jgi:polysaccharide pyruvyl transferase WcaK-like protein
MASPSFLEAIMFTTFLALVFSATTGLRCELNINDRQQVWHISVNIEQYVFTARSKYEGVISKQTAMMEVRYGYDQIWHFLKFCGAANPRRNRGTADMACSLPARPGGE